MFATVMMFLSSNLPGIMPRSKALLRENLDLLESQLLVLFGSLMGTN